MRPDRVRVADRVLDEGRHLAQHVVAGGVAAGVVDRLEAVEVEIAQRVHHVAGLRGIDGFLQAALEFAAVHQPGERIVARLVSHLAGDAAQFAGVVQHQHHA